MSEEIRQISISEFLDLLPEEQENVVTRDVMLMMNSDVMIYEIADRLGFPEPTAFNRYFKREAGMTPLEYKKS